MISSVRLVLILLVLGAVGAGYLYVQNLQKNLQIATANNAKLEAAVTANEQTIRVLQADYARSQAEIQRINQAFAASRVQNNLLRDRLKDANLGPLAESKPESVERLVNQGTASTARCFELLSGAPLTDQEREATSENEFNRECPWLWPGNTSAQ